MSAQVLHASPLVVSPVHVRILQMLAKAEREYGSVDLHLEGGTALSAYYLLHRQSEDLDLFGGPGMNARDFRTFFEGFLTTGSLHIVDRGSANQGFAELLVSDQPPTVPAIDRQNVKVQFCRTSPFHLSPPIPTSEGVPVASYRDVCAGKLHAICDRYEPRDFIDLHCILHHRGPDEPVPHDDERRRRFRALVADLQSSDPGLSEVQVGQALARGVDRAIVSEFPLRLLIALEDGQVQDTIRLGLEECADLTRERAGWDHPPQKNPSGDRWPG